MRKAVAALVVAALLWLGPLPVQAETWALSDRHTGCSTAFYPHYRSDGYQRRHHAWIYATYPWASCIVRTEFQRYYPAKQYWRTVGITYDGIGCCAP